MFRFPLIRIEADDAPGAGATGAGDTAAAEGDAGTPNAEQQMLALRAEKEAMQVERDQAVRMATDAKRMDAALAKLQGGDKDVYNFVVSAIRGDDVSLPSATPDPKPEDGLNFDELDENTRAIVGAILKQNELLTDQVKGLSVQVTGLVDRGVSSDFEAQVAKARELMGADVVKELLPKAEALILENPGLANVPDAAMTILKALDHDNVANRVVKQAELDEKSRQEKLLSHRGLGKRGLSAESGPGGKPHKRTKLEVIQSAINAVLQGENGR